MLGYPLSWLYLNSIEYRTNVNRQSATDRHQKHVKIPHSGVPKVDSRIPNTLVNVYKEFMKTECTEYLLFSRLILKIIKSSYLKCVLIETI